LDFVIANRIRDIGERAIQTKITEMLFLQVLAPFNKEINVNARVMQLYTDHLLPGIAAPGDDNNYGSSAMYDGLVLQVTPPPPPNFLAC